MSFLKYTVHRERDGWSACVTGLLRVGEVAPDSVEANRVSNASADLGDFPPTHHAGLELEDRVLLDTCPLSLIRACAREDTLLTEGVKDRTRRALRQTFDAVTDGVDLVPRSAPDGSVYTLAFEADVRRTIVVVVAILRSGALRDAHPFVTHRAFSAFARFMLALAVHNPVVGARVVVDAVDHDGYSHEVEESGLEALLAVGEEERNDDDEEKRDEGVESYVVHVILLEFFRNVVCDGQ